VAITDLLSKGSKLRLTRRDDGSRDAAAAPPVALAGTDLRLPPGVADAPIPADFNLPDAFFAGTTPPAPPMPPFGGAFAPVAGTPAVETAAPGAAPVADPPADDFFGHGAASPADAFFGADAAPGGFFGEDDDEPADDFFRGSASAPMSAVPPPPEVLYAESGRPAAPPNATPPGAPSGASRAGRPAVRRPLPSVAVLAIGALALACLTLLAALVMTASDASPAVASAPDEVEIVTGAAEASPEAPAAVSAAGGAAGSTEGSSVSADQLAALEAAANLPLTGELTAFLSAAEASFGATSAQLDPALRPYAYRLASRFEWNPDTFRISVVAPDAALAQSRVDVLKQVFSDAVASGRLVLVPATGPSALTLVAA